MINSLLKPDSIKVIRLTDSKAIFLHADTLQIYPLDDLDDKELIDFLERYCKGDNQGLITQYGKKEYDNYCGIISSVVENAPKLTTYNFLQYEVSNGVFNTVVLPIDNLLDYYVGVIKSKKQIYNKRFYQWNEIFRFRENKRFACGAGRTYFTIMSSGDIFSCAHFMNLKERSIGNISNNRITPDLYKAIEVEKIEECSKCWARYLCLGHCPSQKISLGKHNDTASTQDECELEKVELELYIKLYYYSKTLAPNVYERKIENNTNEC